MKLDNPKVEYRKSDSTWQIKGNGSKLIYVDACLECGEPFLAEPRQIKLGNGKFCSFKCSNMGRNHPICGPDHYNWRGGVTKKNIPLYDTFAHKIDFAEEVRKTKEGYLEVRCATCNKWFMPTRNAVKSRLQVLNGTMGGGSKLYCSEECKKVCPIHNQQKWPKGHKPYYNREVQLELRKLVLERDNYICIKCGSKERLECHHLDGILYEPLLSADMDECITVCHKCHKEIHKELGCRGIDMVGVC